MPSTPPPSGTGFAILGLLSLKTWSTYELAQQVTRSLNWFWPRAQRRLYDEPKLLVKHGFAHAEKTWTGQRPRTEYGITDAGREALRRWLDEPPAPRAVESEGMLKVFFADAGTREQLERTLQRMEDEARSGLRQLRSMLAGGTAAETPFPQRTHISALTLELQIRQENALIEWAGWAREQVRAWSTATDPGTWDEAGAIGDIVSRLDHITQHDAEVTDAPAT